MTKILTIPGVNGLGVTGGTVKGAEILSKKFNTEKLELDNSNIEEQQNKIYNFIKQRLDNKLIIIGGDHSISFPIGKTFMEKSKNPFLIIFDAHADCDFTNREPTHEEWLRALIEAGFPSECVLFIGLRKTWEVDEKFLEENKIKIFSCKEIKSAYDYILERAEEKEIYISFDIDVFDSAVVNATGYPEQNGLTEEQGLNLLKKLKNLNIKILDLVEFNPEKGGKGGEICIKILEIMNEN